MATQLNNNEVPTRQSNTPHTNSTEQSSANNNYNTEANSRQDTQDKEYIVNQIATILNLGDIHRVGNDIQCRCPFHYPDEHPSFGFSIDKPVYNCLSSHCGRNGRLANLGTALKSVIISREVDNIRDFKVLAQIDPVGFDYKPTEEYGIIRNRMKDQPLREYSINELISNITTGHTISPSGASKNIGWSTQQIIMLDFDIDYVGTTMQDVLQEASSIGLTPTFAYYTFSSTEDVQRFRFCYCFNEPITNKGQFQAILRNMLNKFKNYSVDKACSDLCRMFLGTNNTDVFCSNLLYSPRYSVEQISAVSKLVDNTVMPEFYVDNKFQSHIFAQWLIDKYHIIRLNNTQLHYYSDGIHYNNDYADIESLALLHQKSLKVLQIKEVMNYIQHMATKVDSISPPELIAFNNGVYNLVTGKLEPFDMNNYILTSKLNCNYVEPASVANNKVNERFVNKFFNDIAMGDKDLITLLYEIIGLCCYRSAKFHTAFIFTGTGANGKSTYFRIIQNLVGAGCSNLRLNDLSNNRFALSNLYNKTVNISNDTTQPRFVDTGVLKDIIGGDPLSADKKYEPTTVNFVPFCTFLISINSNLNFYDTTDGLTRRFKVLEFKNKFDGANRDLDIERKLCSPEVMQIIAFRAMQHFGAVLKRGTFTYPKSVKLATEAFMRRNNNVKEFVSLNPIEERIIPRVKKKEYYQEYISWCEDSNSLPVGPNIFNDEMERLGYIDKRIQVDKERAIYYVSKDYDLRTDIEQTKNLITFEDLLARCHVKIENVDFSQVNLNDLNLTDVQLFNLNSFDVDISSLN